MSAARYALVSACRNEEDYLDALIECISRQTLKPSRWIIVDDGSTDRTYESACAAAKDRPFLRVEQMPLGSKRNFASQAYAANHGYALIRSESFDFIGFLDADIRLPVDYYERLIERLTADQDLGLCGGRVLDVYPRRRVSSRAGSENYHVAGGIQFFRRATFEKIGGYVPVQCGGQDSIADVMTLMNGWSVRTFSDLDVEHLRPEGSAGLTAIRRGMIWGRRFYLLGYHPLFYLAQCIRRVGQPPVFIGSLLNGIGFLVASVQRGPRSVSDEFVAFQRRLQLDRLRRSLGLNRSARSAAPVRR
jgi:biofilm PGA synthesis N-glycosyltransferase PgaC